MASKRDVVWQLKRQELQELAKRYDIDIRGDARTIEDLVDSIVRARRLPLRTILELLPRERLKELCRHLDLDDSGRERVILIDRLDGSERDDEESDDTDEAGDAEESTDAAETLQRLLGTALDVSERSGKWPLLGTIHVADLHLDTAIYVRGVVSSHRDPLERRIQNPGSGRGILNHAGRHSLLLGIWRERGDSAAVIVAFDPQVRVGRTTRYSAFLPLSLVEKAADTGFASHVNAKSERIYAFRPENLGRYLRVRMSDGDLRESELVTTASREGIAVSRTRTTPDRVDPTTLGALNIRPKSAMYAAFARLNYKPWFALAEFIDNAIQSFLSNQRALRAEGFQGPLQIDVSIDDAEISVSDRAGGIALSDFPRAFSPATPPADTSGLSEFGLGMKAAACWFSRMWTVRTSALGDPFEREVVFDVPKISREGIEQIPVATRPTKETDHFTVISMRDLRVRPKGSTLAKIRNHLASIYRVLLADDVVRIRLTTAGDSQELKYDAPELLDAPYYRTPTEPPRRWRREFAFDIDGKTVRGWAGIMRSGSQSKAGFSVFRRGRLIEGSVGEAYKPHAIFGSANSFESQRIVGELHVEGFHVSHTKDGIHWDEYEERVVDRVLQELTSKECPLIDQARGYRARKTADQLPASFAADALDGTMVALQSTPGVTESAALETVRAADETPAREEPTVLQQRNFELALVRDGKPWRLRIETVRDPGMDFFTVEGAHRDDAQEVNVRINLDHEFSIAWLNENENAMHPMVRFIAALALGERVARLGGATGAGSVRRSANEWLRKLVRDEEH